MTTTPTISVVIPAYDHADFIEGALDSVAAQTVDAPLEVIVVDDGSPDDVARRAEAHELRPTVVRQSNTGVAAARNRGIEEASGRWIAFLDADDRWSPDKLADQWARVRPMDRPALSFCRYRRHTAGGEPVDRAADHPPADLVATPQRLLHHNFVGTSTVLVHRQCLERCGGFPTDDELDAGGQDYALWLRIAAYFPLVYLPAVRTHYTVHADNRVGADPLEHHRAALRALQNFRRWDPPRFRALSVLPLTGLVAVRTAKFVADSWTRPRAFERGSVPAALAASTTTLAAGLADG